MFGEQCLCLCFALLCKSWWFLFSETERLFLSSVCYLGLHQSCRGVPVTDASVHALFLFWYLSVACRWSAGPAVEVPWEDTKLCCCSSGVGPACWTIKVSSLLPYGTCISSACFVVGYCCTHGVLYVLWCEQFNCPAPGDKYVCCAHMTVAACPSARCLYFTSTCLIVAVDLGQCQNFLLCSILIFISSLLVSVHGCSLLSSACE